MTPMGSAHSSIKNLRRIWLKSLPQTYGLVLQVARKVRYSTEPHYCGTIGAVRTPIGAYLDIQMVVSLSMMQFLMTFLSMM